MTKSFFLILSILVCSQLFAQVLFRENFEGINPQYDATPYYKDQLGSCNSFIVNNTVINCLGSVFTNTINRDITTGTGKFLMHATARTGSTLGEVWGTVAPFTVVANTNYSFQFYLANVFDINVAQIQPFINGVAINPAAVSSVGSGNTSWTKFTFCWNSGSATTADLSLRNLREEAAGNDFVIDEITFSVGDVTRTQNAVICQGGSLRVGTNVYTAAGQYRDRFAGSNRCDSIVVTNLTVTNPSTSTQNRTICQGGSLQITNRIYTTVGTYRDTFRLAAGCDSVLITNLTVTPPNSSTQSATTCSGKSVPLGSKSFNRTGVFRDTIKAVGNCDSILVLNLTVTPPTESAFSSTICAGQNIRVGIKIYDKTGVYRDTFKTSVGCDSVQTTNLAVIRAVNFSQTITAINNGVQVGKNIYRCNGKYVDTLKTSSGCDSIITTEIASGGKTNFFIPNVFSPNDDQMNDKIIIYADALCVKRVIRWSIHDRWGEQVYHAENFNCNDPQFGWNGRVDDKLLKPDVYGYFAEIEFANGTTAFLRGDITLVR